MRKRRRGIAAAEVTVAGAALAFIVSTIVPTMDVLRTQTDDTPRANDSDGGGEEPKPKPKPSHNFKQLAIAVINYEGIIDPILDDVFAAVGDERERDANKMMELNQELGEKAELYHQFLATIRYHSARADSREELDYLREVEARAMELIDHITTMQRFLDVLVVPEEVLAEFESEEEIVEMILSER